MFTFLEMYHQLDRRCIRWEASHIYPPRCTVFVYDNMVFFETAILVLHSQSLPNSLPRSTTHQNFRLLTWKVKLKIQYRPLCFSRIWFCFGLHDSEAPIVISRGQLFEPVEGNSARLELWISTTKLCASFLYDVMTWRPTWGGKLLEEWTTPQSWRWSKEGKKR